MDQDQTQEKKGYYTRETGKKEDHPLKLINYCNDFLVRRTCQLGNKCQERHISYQQLRRELKKVQGPYKKHLCKLYEQGGKCPTPKFYCLFAHGEEDVWGSKPGDKASDKINDAKYDQKNQQNKEFFQADLLEQNQNQRKKNKRGGAMKNNKEQIEKEEIEGKNQNKVQSLKFNIKTQCLEPVLIEREAKNKKKNKNKEKNLLKKFAQEMNGPGQEGVFQIQGKNQKKNNNLNLKKGGNQFQQLKQNQNQKQSQNKPKNKKGKSENQVKRNPKLKSGIVQIDTDLFLQEHLMGGKPLQYDQQSISDGQIRDYEDFADLDHEHQKDIDDQSGDFVTDSEEYVSDSGEELENEDDLFDDEFLNNDGSEISLNQGDFEYFSEQFQNLRVDNDDDEDYVDYLDDQDEDECSDEIKFKNKNKNTNKQKKQPKNLKQKKQNKQFKDEGDLKVVGQKEKQAENQAQIQEQKNNFKADFPKISEPQSSTSQKDFDFYNSSNSSSSISSSLSDNETSKKNFSKKYPSKEKQRQYQKEKKNQKKKEKKISKNQEQQVQQQKKEVEQKKQDEEGENKNKKGEEQNNQVFKKTKLIKNKQLLNQNQNKVTEFQNLEKKCANDIIDSDILQEPIQQIIDEKIQQQQKFQREKLSNQQLEHSKNDVILNQDQLKKLLKQNKLQNKGQKNKQNSLNNQGLNLAEKISVFCFLFFKDGNDPNIEKYVEFLEKQLVQNGFLWEEFELKKKKILYSPKINKDKLKQQQKCQFYQEVSVKRETGIKLLQLNMIKNSKYSIHFKVMPSPEIQIVFSNPIKIKQSINNLSFLSDKNEICYVYGSKLEQPESYHNEYKLYDLKKTHNSTKILENVVTSMLNNHIMYPEQNQDQGETIGQITLGVRDEDRILEGIYCPKNVTETFFTILRKRFNDTLPSINQFVQKNSYRVVVPNHDNTQFYPILNCNVHVLSICRPQKQLNKLFQGKSGGFLERIEEGSWPISSFKLFQLYQKGYVSEAQLEEGLKQYDNRYFYVISRKIDTNYKNNQHFDKKQDSYFEEHVIQSSSSENSDEEDDQDYKFYQQVGGSEQSE
ncbi:hypothetical protein PPERSA_12678 [Pseudocohnilembus persalinus]|uniref:C3H1-type domain-containing protein n=1 Tax=Pseudocohnilembus persalinus TaxID=266149 RepID=A0A0V0QN38_PSEPJ|nr:hypothetical protein PPERSA_12678 [Pseudocohnilembus persalinus]|eukprot:KRX03548.1 hypothetical protein PPERSA_12678 [Pseudocohnilembus persalinus]